MQPANLILLGSLAPSKLQLLLLVARCVQARQTKGTATHDLEGSGSSRLLKSLC